MKERKKNLKRIAFTLIEVMVTMSIISLLSSVVFSATKSAKNKAVDRATEAQGGQYRTALALYKNDNGNYPKAVSTQTLSLSGRDFNVACLGTGCILNDQPIDPLPFGTLTKYIDDTQPTIAPQFIADGKVQKGIFLVTCSLFEICGDETYIMSTVTIPSDGSCTGVCILSGSGGSLVLSNTTQGSGSVVGGSCSDPTYNTTSQVLCEVHGRCSPSSATTQDECGQCSSGTYSNKTTCEGAGTCYGKPNIYSSESECTAIENGYCSGSTNFTTPSSCNDAGLCSSYGNGSLSQYDGNQSACLNINNGSCYQAGTAFPAYSYNLLDNTPSGCTDAGYCTTGTGNITMRQEDCTPDMGTWFSYDQDWRLNNWLSQGYHWELNTWSSYGLTWIESTWTPNVWTPAQ